MTTEPTLNEYDIAMQKALLAEQTENSRLREVIMGIARLLVDLLEEDERSSDHEWLKKAT